MMIMTEQEREYLCLLGQKKTFDEMAIELGWTVDEVEDFGTKFFDRIFEERKKGIQ